MSLDLIITGGTLIDGTGAPAVRADVAIEAGRIAAIGGLAGISGVPELDARGLYVTPGFIDIHSHSDLTLLVDPRAASAIAQGVTTEAIGNCGHGCAPIVDPKVAAAAIYGPVHAVDFNWRSVADYLTRLEQVRPAVNVLALVPNGQLRLGAIGPALRRAGAEELRVMKYRLAEGMEQGAFGYSTGLEYAQEIGAPEEEITELCREAARLGGIYATHTRERDAYAAEAVAEAIRTARHAGVRLQISHIVPRSGIDVVRKCLDFVDRGRDAGVDVAFDMHTRLFGFTHLKNIVPTWVLAGTPAEIAVRLADPAVRTRIAGHPNLIASLGDWERVLLVHSRHFAEYNGLAIAEIARRWGTDPLGAGYDILAGEAEEILRPMVILKSYSEDVLEMAYRHPLCMVGSDATTLTPNGKLADETFYGAYTWASWFWRRMVREKVVFTPEQAVEKLSALPARTLGLRDRGVLRQGAWADIIAFDPATFGETGTVEQPNRPAVGMAHVLVNGVPTRLHGTDTGRRRGAIIRR
jgi:N-acyl-D-aspartate/D-glutamate deacylase